MRQLGGDKVGLELLKPLWRQRLPECTQVILTYADSGFLEVLAATADKIHDVHAQPLVAEVSHESAEVTELRRQLVVLPNLRSRERSGSRTVRSASNSSLCWYQCRFANQAKRCTHPKKRSSLGGAAKSTRIASTHRLTNKLTNNKVRTHLNLRLQASRRVSVPILGRYATIARENFNLFEQQHSFHHF